MPKIRKFCATKLAKKLSLEVLGRIENNELDEKEITEELIQVAFKEKKWKGCTSLVEEAAIRKKRYPGVFCFASKMMAIRVSVLALYVIPGEGPRIESLRRQKFLISFYEGLRVEAEKRQKFQENIIVKAGFDRACQEHQSSIIKSCYGGSSRKFRKGMAIFSGATLEEFTAIVDSLIQAYLETHPFKEIYDSVDVLYKVALRLKMGAYKELNECWSCRKTMDHALACGRCNVALYCGTKCQQEAWRTGHKHSCKDVKWLYDEYSKDQDVVKKALSDPEGHERRYGYKPNRELDYLVLGDRLLLRVNGLGSVSRQASVAAAFYENLSQVKQGLLWSDSIGQKPETDHVKKASFQMIRSNGIALSYPYAAIDPEDVTKSFNERNSELRQNVEKVDELVKCTHNCTAAQYLKYYTMSDDQETFDYYWRETSDLWSNELLRRYDTKRRYRNLQENLAALTEKRDSLQEVIEEIDKVLLEIEREKILALKKRVHLELLEVVGSPRSESSESTLRTFCWDMITRACTCMGLLQSNDTPQ